MFNDKMKELTEAVELSEQKKVDKTKEMKDREKGDKAKGQSPYPNAGVGEEDIIEGVEKIDKAIEQLSKDKEDILGRDVING